MGERRGGGGRHARRSAQTVSRGGMQRQGTERETTVPSNPQSETTRRGDETLTEFSSDSRGAERDIQRQREREREREGGGGREHVRICKSERRGEAESKRARGGIERTATPAARTTSPLLASRRSASPRLASPTVNHLRCPVPKVRQSRSSMRDSRALRLVLHGHERKKNDGKRKKE
jgi:hypothetical protein